MNDLKSNTYKSFYDKWHNNPSSNFNTNEVGSTLFEWILERNGIEGENGLKNWLCNRKKILDAGCGNGRVTKLLCDYAPPKSEITGIDLTSHEIASKNLKNYSQAKFLKGDLTEDLLSLGKFDFIYCQEVLHHTNNPEKAFDNLCSILEANGEIAVYLYKKKAPLREYCDDFVRSKVQNLNYDETMEIMNDFTNLAKQLSSIDALINIHKDIPILGITEGEYTVQRFIYHFFSKMFWNDEFSFNDNSLINYDWYHPQLSSRHEIKEIIGWFKKNNLRVIHQNVDHYGITVRGLKKD